MQQTRNASDTPEFQNALVEVLPHLRAFARSLTRRREQADDLVNDAVVRALSAAAQFQPGTNFKAWMFTILRNLYYNGRRRQSSRFSSIDDMPGLEPSIEPSQESALAFNDFRRAFFQLTDVHREVLTLVGAGGLSYEEAAAVCDCRVGTVKSRVSRARAELKELLEGNKLQLTRRQMTDGDKDELTESLETGVDPQQVVARRAKGR